MKIVVINKSKRILGIVAAILAGFILINAVGYFFDFKYVSVFAAMEEVNKYEVRSRLLMEAMNFVGACNPESTSDVWANGLKMRSAAMQYSVMSKGLKNVYAKQLEESFPNWVTGVSSPWVDSYKITKNDKPDENTNIITLKFVTKTSAGPAGEYNAVLTIIHEGDYWRISKINADEELYVYTGYKQTNQ